MKKCFVFILSILIAASSCSTNSENNDDSSSEEYTIEFVPTIRQNVTANDVGKTFTDTLIFQEVNFDADYAFAVFKTLEGDMVYAKYNEEIDESLSGKLFEIKWEVDSFYEAGEGDLLYFSESLISYKNLGPVKQELIIEGNNIWVRESPKTGKVAFTLDNGATCLVLEKGESQVIGGNKDFWYKIGYKGKTGWVFGAQTNLKYLSACNFPKELTIHPPKNSEPNAFGGVLDNRFFPIGVSKNGVFAYLDFEGELDPCECVHASLNLYNIESGLITKTIKFRTDLEEGPMDDWDIYIDPKKVWEVEKEKFCTVLEQENVIIKVYDIIKDEELETTYQITSSPSGIESVMETIKYAIFDDVGTQVFKSKENTEIITAELAARLRYKIGEDNYFVTVVATTHPGYEGSIIRSYAIF